VYASHTNGGSAANFINRIQIIAKNGVVLERIDNANQLAAAKINGAQVERLSGTRADISREGQQVPPPLSLMFAMKKGTAKTIQAGDNRGWFVVYLTDIVKGDASGQSDMLKARKQELSGILQQEYVAQMVLSAAKDVGVEKNEDGIAEVRTRLTNRDGN